MFSEFILFITTESLAKGKLELITGLIGLTGGVVELETGLVELLFNTGRTGRSIGILIFKHFLISWFSMKPSMHSVHYWVVLFHCEHVSLFNIKFPFSEAK